MKNVNLNEGRTIALRIEPKLKRKVELVAKVLHIYPSEWSKQSSIRGQTFSGGFEV